MLIKYVYTTIHHRILLDNIARAAWVRFLMRGCVHMAPPAERVPYLMADLFDWLKHSPDHLLVRSCVFHYEFEFIHPFADGDGRMGR